MGTTSPRSGRVATCGLSPSPLDPFHEQVARVALEVADQYGFVLGGGLALILHGAMSRPTEDIDLRLTALTSRAYNVDGVTTATLAHAG